VKLADHAEIQLPALSEDIADPALRPKETGQVLIGRALLFHPIFNGLDGARGVQDKVSILIFLN
jgi:hypothetical protein